MMGFLSCTSLFGSRVQGLPYPGASSLSFPPVNVFPIPRVPSSEKVPFLKPVSEALTLDPQNNSPAKLATFLVTAIAVAAVGLLAILFLGKVVVPIVTTVGPLLCTLATIMLNELFAPAKQRSGVIPDFGLPSEDEDESMAVNQGQEKREEMYEAVLGKIEQAANEAQEERAERLEAEWGKITEGNVTHNAASTSSLPSEGIQLVPSNGTSSTTLNEVATEIEENEQTAKTLNQAQHQKFNEEWTNITAKTTNQTFEATWNPIIARSNRPMQRAHALLHHLAPPPTLGDLAHPVKITAAL